MKKIYILSTLCIASLAQGMEVTTTREAREWDAQAYAKGNFIQKRAASQFIEESGINFKGYRVLDVGCGTGDITAEIAKSAKKVHGIDASNNMIKYAQDNYDDIPNISFRRCFAEDFTTQKLYDYAVSFSCLHWIEDKKQVFERIYHSLKNGGEFLGTIISTTEPMPLSLKIGMEIIIQLSKTDSRFQNITQEKGIGISYLSDEEIKEIIEKTGFTIVSYEKKHLEYAIKNPKELVKIFKPGFMSRPLFNACSKEEKKSIFNQFINLYSTKLEKDNDGNYIFPELHTTVIRIQK